MGKLSLSSVQWVQKLIHTSVKTSCEQRFLFRLCVLLIAEGRSCYEAVRWLGEDPRIIERRCMRWTCTE